MKDRKVSFIVVNWNGLKTVEECLDSLLAQTYDNCEIILVDNHSTDGSLELIQNKYGLDKIIPLDQNRGYAEANNIGYAHAAGDYIALINNDAVLDRHWLEKAVAVFESKGGENVGSVATKNIHYHQRGIIDTAGVEFLGFGAGWDYKGLAADSPKVNRRKEVFGAVATAALYRKAVLDRVGLFDPCYFIYFEDTDLAFRLRLFGYPCVYEPEAVCFHHGGVKREKSSPYYIRYGRRNIEFLFVKNMQGRLFVRYCLAHWAYEFCLFLFFLMTGKGVSFLKAKLDFLKNLGYLVEERKKLKRNLIAKKRYAKIHEVERRFLRPRHALRDKLRKAVSTCRSFMHLG